MVGAILVCKSVTFKFWDESLVKLSVSPIWTVRTDSRRLDNHVWKISFTLSVISLSDKIKSLFTNGWGYSSSQECHIQTFVMIEFLDKTLLFSQIGQ